MTMCDFVILLPRALYDVSLHTADAKLIIAETIPDCFECQTIMAMLA